MTEIGSFSQHVRTSTVTSESLSMDESSFMATSSSSSPSIFSWGIQYKIIREPKLKGIWNGYQTQEEFMAMHLR
ncbi:unnamed protein product [Rotaria sp. Silwood1]|nr:unnamed protein product [Rotaria sp. Silwood1]CAF0741606.1 unnamed protein product [Rotaria sp. Silwood1]CAF3327654.1 unnamed protein product [Rotaria sp. Silwood1]CAF3346042.1 unnamed protein product [Rotaria sp. Silwood1]CAF4596549.1 unnamed protein product [Rotaria sp. Silwood1]